MLDNLDDYEDATTEVPAGTLIMVTTDTALWMQRQWDGWTAALNEPDDEMPDDDAPNCPNCNGTGDVSEGFEDSQPRPCQQCNGTGGYEP